MTEHVELHRDGSVRARGPMVDGAREGHWEWFRLDGSRMRSGWFEHGEQVGRDATGRPVSSVDGSGGAVPSRPWVMVGWPGGQSWHA